MSKGQHPLPESKNISVKIDINVFFNQSTEKLDPEIFESLREDVLTESSGNINPTLLFYYQYLWATYCINHGYFEFMTDLLMHTLNLLKNQENMPTLITDFQSHNFNFAHVLISTIAQLGHCHFAQNNFDDALSWYRICLDTLKTYLSTHTRELDYIQQQISDCIDKSSKSSTTTIHQVTLEEKREEIELSKKSLPVAQKPKADLPKPKPDSISLSDKKDEKTLPAIKASQPGKNAAKNSAKRKKKKEKRKLKSTDRIPIKVTEPAELHPSQENKPTHAKTTEPEEKSEEKKEKLNLLQPESPTPCVLETRITILEKKLSALQKKHSKLQKKYEEIKTITTGPYFFETTKQETHHPELKSLYRDTHVNLLELQDAKVIDYLASLPSGNQVKCKTLSELRVCNVGLTVNLIAKLVQFITIHDIDLHTLNLSNTDLTTMELQALVSQSSKTNSLSCLDVCGNRLIGDDCLRETLLDLLAQHKFLIQIKIDADIIDIDRERLIKTQLVRNRLNYVEIVNICIYKNNADSIRTLYTDDLILNSINPFIHEGFFQMAAEGNYIDCVQVFLELPLVKNPEILLNVANKVRTSFPEIYQLIISHVPVGTIDLEEPNPGYDPRTFPARITREQSAQTGMPPIETYDSYYLNYSS